MKTLQRPPIFTFRDVTQVAFEYGRIFQLPHDVLYDFKIMVQIEEPWIVLPVDEVKTTIKNPWDVMIQFHARVDMNISKECELFTAALLNEFGEIVGFKDLYTAFESKDIFKSLTYILSTSYNCERQQQYA